MPKEEIEGNILRRYEISKILGSGAYGIVWRAEERQTKRVVAIKKIFDAFQNASDAQRTFREIMFLLEVDHPNIIKLLNVHRALNDRDIYLVFESMSADLHTAIRAGILTSVHQQYVMYQLLATIKYLHSASILHRDLKPSNVLLDHDCFVKLADFGLARSILSVEQELRPVLTDYIATRWYRPPEILLGCTLYTKGVDIWALGCILGELLLGSVLFPGRSTAHQLELILEVTGEPTQEEIAATNSPFVETMLRGIRRVEKRSLSKIIPQASPEAIDLLGRMLRFNPLERITAEEALQHPYVVRFTKERLQPVAPGPILVSLPDDERYSVSEYRAQLYKELLARRRASTRGGKAAAEAAPSAAAPAAAAAAAASGDISNGPANRRPHSPTHHASSSAPSPPHPHGTSTSNPAYAPGPKGSSGSGGGGVPSHHHPHHSSHPSHGSSLSSSQGNIHNGIGNNNNSSTSTNSSPSYSHGVSSQQTVGPRKVHRNSVTSPVVLHRPTPNFGNGNGSSNNSNSGSNSSGGNAAPSTKVVSRPLNSPVGVPTSVVRPGPARRCSGAPSSSGASNSAAPGSRK